MKKIYAAIVLLALITVLGFVEYRLTQRSAELILESADNALKAAETGDSRLLELCESADRHWHERKPALEIFLPHTELDAADIVVHRLVVYARHGDTDNTKVCLAELENRMNSLRESEEISLYNLF